VLDTHYDTADHNFDENDLVCKMRSHYEGDDTTVYIKYVHPDPDVCRGAPLDPAPGYDNEMKLEEDISACSNRWSRATKVKGLKFNKTFTQLGDITKYIPGVLDFWPNSSDKQALIIDKQYWTWSFSISDNKLKDTEFEMTLSAIYASLDEAMSGTAQPLEEAEVSFRVTGNDKGDNVGTKTAARAWNLFYTLLEHAHVCTCKSL
jgi:hypothetical protein